MKVYKTKINRVSLVREATEIAKVKIKSSIDAVSTARRLYNQANDLTLVESFFTIMLNNANNTIGYTLISKGGITGTLIDIRIIAKTALDCLATSVILVHNHPSGSLEPSRADIAVTEKIKKGLKLLDIDVLDHLILTEDAHYSFSQDDRL